VDGVGLGGLGGVGGRGGVGGGWSKLCGGQLCSSGSGGSVSIGVLHVSHAQLLGEEIHALSVRLR
jgi:hypothetical protein